MDLINQTTAQLRELFASMTPGARVTAGLLLTVVVVSLGFLFQQAAAGPDAYLFGGEVFSASKIGRMEAAMAAAGVTNFSSDGNRLRVPRGQKETAIAAIASAGELPADVFDLMDDAISGGSWLDPIELKRQRMHSAREKMLSGIISKMPWVDHAYVLITEHEAVGLRGKRRATAAVSIQPAVGEMVTPHHQRSVIKLVSSSADISPEQVSVTNLGGDPVAAGAIGAEDYDEPLYRTKTLLEKHIKSKLLEQFDHIKGIGVQVNAVLDPTMERRLTQVKPEGQPQSLKKRETTENSSQTRGGPGGRPGLAAQGPGRQGPDDNLAAQERNTTSVEDLSNESVIGSSREELFEQGPRLKEAWASIRIPRSHIREVYRQQKQNEGEEVGETIAEADIKDTESKVKEEVENLAQAILPQLSLGEDEFKQVKVEVVEVLPRPAPPAAGAAAGALGLVSEYANTLGLAGLALVSLVMLRSFASTKPTDPTDSFPSLRLDTELDASKSGGAAGPDDDDARPRLKLKRADSLKDDLTDMVATDPDAAAAILRSWINNAG
ncbi:MAG: hypothetical protein AAFV43_12890 [Planctomycetota bacterium]